MSTRKVYDEKNLKKLKVYLPLSQLEKINELPMDGSLSIKLEKMIDIAFAAMKVKDAE